MNESDKAIKRAEIISSIKAAHQDIEDNQRALNRVVGGKLEYQPSAYCVEGYHQRIREGKARLKDLNGELGELVGDVVDVGGLPSILKPQAG